MKKRYFIKNGFSFVHDADAQQLPKSTISDSGKLLAVGEDGNAQWKDIKASNIKADNNQSIQDNINDLDNGKLDANKASVASVGGLVSPSSILANNELVGVGVNGDQIRIQLGDGLSLSGDTSPYILNASGSGSEQHLYKKTGYFSAASVNGEYKCYFEIFSNNNDDITLNDINTKDIIYYYTFYGAHSPNDVVNYGRITVIYIEEISEYNIIFQKSEAPNEIVTLSTATYTSYTLTTVKKEQIF